MDRCAVTLPVLDRDALACKVFVDSTVGAPELLRAIEARFGPQVGVSTIAAPFAEIDVRRNEDCVERSRRAVADDFVYFRCYLDIVPSAAIDRDAYVSGVVELLAYLRGHDWPAVASCDFEDELQHAVAAVRPSE
jgi:hypothetical protein